MRQYHKYTAEEKKFLNDNANRCTKAELTELFNRHFGLQLRINQIRKSALRPLTEVVPSRKYTPEQLQFIRDNTTGHTRAELVNLFNRHFGLRVSKDSMKSILKYYNMTHGIITQQYHHYTTDEKQFIRDNLADHSYAEIIKLFYQRYGLKLCEKQIVKATTKDERQKLKYPRTHKIGTEIKEHGYTFVKIAEPDVWERKHILVWKKANGPVPKDKVVTFADGNKSNFDLDNLILITRKELGMMCSFGLIYNNKELTKIGKIIADIKIAIKEREHSNTKVERRGKRKAKKKNNRRNV